MQSPADFSDPKYAALHNMLSGMAAKGEVPQFGPGGVPMAGPPGAGMGGPGMSPADMMGMMGGPGMSPADMDPAALEAMMQQYEGVIQEKMREGFSEEELLGKVDPEGGVMIRPEAGFVLKTDDLDSGQKIFLNVCSSDHVEKPHEQAIPDSEDVGIRVPLSVGPAEEDFDKKMQPCVTYDVVVNPASVQAADEDINYRHMVCQLVIGATEQKYSLRLNPKYRMPRTKYKTNAGSSSDQVRVQRIKAKKMGEGADIQEVESKAAPIDAASKPAYDFSVWYEAEGEEPLDGLTLACYSEEVELQQNLREKVFRQEAQQVDISKQLRKRTAVYTVVLPGVKTLQGVRVDISDECATIAPQGLSSDPLTLWFPCDFCSRNATAEWRAATHELVLRVPCSAFTAVQPTEDPDVFANALSDLTF